MEEATTQLRDLDTQIAVSLFGWRWLADAQLWRDPDGLVCEAQTGRRRLPAYSRVPEATALVWQWVEQQAGGLLWIEFQYRDGFVACYPMSARHEATGAGATWPEALCRAALALAELLKQEEK